ncbi:hypothetical protein [Pimelobacter simplex]|uniref:hypothetical protein n=1 Tax=Nocardioides simplex TaxID=2045 RepID=UPI001932E19B|nr:hypothetical protein [Pimelobacter simplex]
MDTTAPSAPGTSATVEPSPTAAPVLGSLELAPGTGVKDGQKIKVTIGGYGQLTGKASVVLCSPAVVSDTSNPQKYCDMRPESMGMIEISGGAGSGSFTVRVGESFQAELPTSTCEPGGKCLVLATSTTQDPQYASIAEVAFAS